MSKASRKWCKETLKELLAGKHIKNIEGRNLMNKNILKKKNLNKGETKIWEFIKIKSTIPLGNNQQNIKLYHKQLVFPKKHSNHQGAKRNNLMIN